MNELISTDGIDFFSLKLFGVLAETGSFTRTAESLGLTQSAVSRHLQRLEDNVGVRLFERTTRQVRLTEAGQFFRKKSGSLLGTWQNSLHELQETFVDGPKRIRIALSETVGFSYLPGFVASYKKERPEDTLEISQAVGSVIITDVMTQNLECGVLTDRGSGFPAEIEVIYRFEDRFVGIAPPDSTVENADGLFSEPMILLAANRSLAAAKTTEFLKEHVSTPKIAMEAQGYDFIINLVSGGFGCGIVPIRALALYGKRKPVKRIPLDTPFSRNLAIIARRDNQRPDHLERFMKLILY